MDTILTVGHSTRLLAEFLVLLREAGVAQIADVRRFPRSRRHPQFAGPALSASLEEAGLAYRHFEALGGFRAPRPDSPHRGWSVEAFRGYADYMESAEFAAALAALAAWARSAPTAILCAEADPRQCHRQLISDALLCRGLEVRHLLGVGAPQVHALTPFARVVGERILYDGRQGTLDLGGPG